MFLINMKDHSHSHPQLPKDFEIGIYGMQSVI